MIRPATAEDADRIARVHVRSWQGGYTHVFPAKRLAELSVERRAAQWLDWLSAQNTGLGVFVAEQQGTVDGFVSVGPSSDVPGEGELFAIYVDPDHWGTGVGRALIVAGEEWLRSRGYSDVTLWVLEDNPRARRFYEAAGWRADGSSRTGEHLGVRTSEVRYRKELHARVADARPPGGQPSARGSR